MFFGALVDSKKLGYQKHDIDFLTRDLLKWVTIRNTDSMPIKNNNNQRQENKILIEGNDVETDSSNDC